MKAKNMPIPWPTAIPLKNMHNTVLIIFIILALNGKHKFINSVMDKIFGTFIHHPEIEQTTSVCNNTDNSHKYNAEKIKQDSKAHLLWFHYLKFKNKQN